MSDQEPGAVFQVRVFWKGEAAEAQGPNSLFGGVSWVCEKPDKLVLVSEEGVEQPPRRVIHYEDVCGWHETTKQERQVQQGGDDGSR